MGMNSFTTCFASALGVALVAMLAASGPTEWLGLGSTTGVCEIDATEGVPDNFAERYYAAGKPVLLRKHRANRVSCMEESMCALRSFQINFAEFQEHGLAVEGSVTVVQPKSLPPAIRTPAPFFDGPGVWAAIHADAPQLLVGVGYKPDGPWRAERDKWVEVLRGRFDWLLYPPQTIPPGGFGSTLAPGGFPPFSGGGGSAAVMQCSGERPRGTAGMTRWACPRRGSRGALARV